MLCATIPMWPLTALPGLLSTGPHLFSSLLNDKEGVGPIRNGEGKSVFEGVAAVMAIADTVLVDVFHSEGGGLVKTLPPGSSLDGAMTWRLHNGEGDGLSLCVHIHCLQLKLGDGLPHTLLHTHAPVLHKGPRIIHRVNSDGEGLCHLEQ